MISNPPQTDNQEINVWNREVRHKFNNYIQSLIVNPSTLGTGAGVLKGKHPGQELDATEKAYFETIIPNSAAQFKEAGIRVIPTTTGTIDYTVNFQYGSVGASFSASSKTSSVLGLAVTDGIVQEIDLPLTTFFTDLSVNDQLAIEFVLDALHTTTKLYILNFYLKYI